MHVCVCYLYLKRQMRRVFAHIQDISIAVFPPQLKDNVSLAYIWNILIYIINQRGTSCGQRTNHKRALKCASVKVNWHSNGNSAEMKTVRVRPCLCARARARGPFACLPRRLQHSFFTVEICREKRADSAIYGLRLICALSLLTTDCQSAELP